MKRTYQRSQILSFCELNEKQQSILLADSPDEELINDSYVLWNDEPLPLSMFMRCDGGLWSGSYMLSAFSGYLVRINRTGECATVVYSHW